MTYELAKQLKEAGFTQAVDGSLFIVANGLVNPKDFEPGNVVLSECCRVPTLSELIEACGDKFRSVIRESNDLWIAVSSDDFPTPSTHGSTPEIAVAKLWLALKNAK